MLHLNMIKMIQHYHQIDLQTKILNTLTDYTEGDLETFDRPFRHSKVLSLIDNTDKSILNSTVPTVTMGKFFTP